MATRPRGKGRPIPSNPVRDAVLSAVKTHSHFAQHPAETASDGTKYLSAFLARNGRAIAFDKALASKQPVWVRDEPRLRDVLNTQGIPFDGYPPEKGRSSNLKKLPEFRGQQLLRAFPRNADEAMAIVESVARLD